MRTFLLVCGLLALPSASRADCDDDGGTVPTAVTPKNTVLAGGGGFLIAELPPVFVDGKPFAVTGK